ncbi:hypothetical protein PR048_005517 [Dryococelus australis]|uniref:HAT C-terminal dimerisation domain-containing protein n=1 Tax=Dryococelus australis TaxID=614101 RepID=A0ABQ9I8J9_9NEOP|nr:hypothetical protein PR048_005517 [Dryococelus australis]
MRMAEGKQAHNLRSTGVTTSDDNSVEKIWTQIQSCVTEQKQCLEIQIQGIRNTLDFKMAGDPQMKMTITEMMGTGIEMERQAADLELPGARLPEANTSTKSVDLVCAFKETLSRLNLQHLQVSFDGPNVNIKFLRDLKENLSEDKDPEHSVMLFMGTCGLHELSKKLTGFREMKQIGLKGDFRKVCASPVVVESVKKYSRKQQRLDNFWSTLLSGFSVPDLLNFVKKVLILSHGNASVERGFSVNKELVVENQAQKALVAQRQVYDGVVASGGLHDLKVCKKMIHCARNASRLYAEALRLKDFQSKDKKQEVLGKKWICERLKELSAK